MKNAWNTLKENLKKVEIGMKNHYRHIKEDIDTIDRAEKEALEKNPFEE